MQYYERGAWQPYTHDELLYVLTEAFKNTPEYCRLTRVIRDIPSPDIVTGNQLTNFRQIVEQELTRQGEPSPEIRAREIRDHKVLAAELQLDELAYETSGGQEVFLQYITAERQIAGFLRLALPDKDLPPLTDELQAAAMIREIHVYGQSLGIGETANGRAQHAGLGTQLIERAVEIAIQQGYQRLAVISAIGTRDYYRKRGFVTGNLYQTRMLV